MSNKVPLAQATKESRKLKSVAKPKDMILDPMGQWKHPGENTRIPSNNITMEGVPYPVLAKPNVGQPVMMQPGAHYTFPGADYVDEFPKFAGGGMVEATVDENGEPKCPDGYDYNSATGYCEKKSSKCPNGYKPDGKGGCIEDRCQPGYEKDASGNCVPDTSGAIYVEDENDPRYQDYLTRRKLNHISNIENPEIRRNAYYNMKKGYDTYDQFYDPEKGYTFDNIKTEDGRTVLSGKDGYPVTTLDNIDPNKGDYDSKREIYKGLTIDQAKDLEAYARSKGFDMGDRFDPYSDSDYEPDQFTEKYKPSKFDADVYYINSVTPNFSFDRSTGKYLQPDTAIVEDKINRERLKKYYPNITDEDINDDYASYYNSYISNIKDDYNSLWPQYSADPEISKQIEVINRPGNITLEQHKKNIQDSAKAPNVINAPLNVTYDADYNPTIKGRRTSYKPDLVQDWINSTGRVVPYYDAPTDNYKFVTQPKSAELIQETQRAVPKFDDPELNLKKGNLPKLTQFGPLKDRKHIRYNNPFIAGTSNRPLNYAPYSAALRAFTGYKKGDEQKLHDEIKAANAEGRPVNLKGIPLMGKTDLKHRRLYKKALKEYEKNLPAIELENERRRQQHEQELKGLNLRRQAEEAKRIAAGLDPDALVEWKKGGGLKSKKYSKSLEATNRLFREHPLFEKAKKLSKKRIYDPSAYYFQDGGEQDGMNGMMKARLAYANEFGNPAAQRMINIPDNPYQFENGDIGTHYMASYDNYAVPQIQDENGQLMLGDYGPDSREAMRFDSDEDADYFAEHYKDVSPGFMELELSPEEIEEYAKGGYIVEDISVPELSGYAEGGQPCPDGYIINPKTGECIEWNPRIAESYDDPTSYNPVNDTIYMNPSDRPEGMSDEEYEQMYQDQLEHEQLHRLQNVNDELRGEGKTPLRMPSPADNQEYDGPHYYNRRQEESDYLHNYWKNQHPNEAQFMPDEVIYNKETDPAMYEIPWTVEGEARDYEYATHDGMPSFFPKRKYGGILNTYADGGTPSQIWEEYTGTPWSEAKARGLTDGSIEQNLALVKRLQSGEFGQPKKSTVTRSSTPKLKGKGTTLMEQFGMLKETLAPTINKVKTVGTKAYNSWIDEQSKLAEKEPKNLENKVPKKFFDPGETFGGQGDWYKEAMMPDSFLENVGEFIDFTGLSSHDDAYRAYTGWDESGEKLPSLGQAADMFGAVPFLGKFGKLKYLVKGEGLVKSAHKYFPWQQVLNAFDTADDIETDNTNKKKKGGALDSYAGGGETECGDDEKWDDRLQKCVKIVQNLSESTIYDPAGKKIQTTLFQKLKDAKDAYQNFTKQHRGKKYRLNEADSASSIEQLRKGIQLYKDEYAKEQEQTRAELKKLENLKSKAALKGNTDIQNLNLKDLNTVKGKMKIDAAIRNSDLDSGTIAALYKGFGLDEIDANVKKGSGSNAQYSAKEAKAEWKPEIMQDVGDYAHMAAMGALGIAGGGALSGAAGATGKVVSKVLSNPFISTPLTAYGLYDATTNTIPEAYRDFSEGRYWEGLGNTAMAALDLYVPGFGKGIKTGIKGLGKVAKYAKNMESAGVGPLMLLKPTGDGLVQKNIPYYKQLLDSYDSKKMSASDKKFYNALINTANKQNGMLTQAQLNELDRLKTGNFDFGKRGYNKESLIQVEPKSSLGSEEIAKESKTKRKLSQKIEDLDSLLGEGLGYLVNNKNTQRKIDEGNSWLKNWIEHPETQAKIDNDFEYVRDRAMNNPSPWGMLDAHDLAYMQAKSFEPNSKMFPLKKQFRDYRNNKSQIHSSNFGTSYMHPQDPYVRHGVNNGSYTPFERYGSWISRSPFTKDKVSTTIHEGTHDWVGDFTLRNSGQKASIENNYTKEQLDNLRQWEDLNSKGIKPETVMGKKKAYEAYMSDPAEVHARIMELRKHFNLTPKSTQEITTEEAEKILKAIKKSKTPIDSSFADVVNNDPDKLKYLFKRLWAAPIATAGAVGTAAMLANPFQGSDGLQQQKKGGATKNFIELELPKNEIQDYINQGYIVEEVD